jgi:hypothetical protein
MISLLTDPTRIRSDLIPLAACRYPLARRTDEILLHHRIERKTRGASRLLGRQAEQALTWTPADSSTSVKRAVTSSPGSFAGKVRKTPRTRSAIRFAIVPDRLSSRRAPSERAGGSRLGDDRNFFTCPDKTTDPISP